MSIAAQSLVHMDPKVLQRAVLGLPTNPKIEPYAALSALQAQNKATRMKQAQMAQAPAATTPVASRTLAENAELTNPYAAGLGVAPVASPVSEAPVGMAGGGMVAFADGGDVKHFVQGGWNQYAPSGYGNQAPTQEEELTPEQLAEAKRLREMGLGSLLSEKAGAAYNWLTQIPEHLQPKTTTRTEGGGFESQVAQQIAALEEKTGRTLSEGAKDVLRQQEMAKLLKDSKGVKNTADMPTPANIKTDKSGLAGAAAVRNAPSMGAGAGARGAANVGLGAAAGRGGYDLGLPAQQTTDERLAEIESVKERMGAKNAEFLKPMQEQLDKYSEEAKAQKTQGKYEALMQAGLGMMAGKSRYAMQNIGEGGAAGLAALRESNKLGQAAQDKLMQAQNDMAKSRIALEKGDETAAMQFANQGRQEMKDRATLQLQAQHYANSDAAQAMMAQAAVSRANALGGNEDKHTATLAKVRGLLNQDPQYKELAKMAALSNTAFGKNAQTQMAAMERKLYQQLAPELLQGEGGNTMGAGGPQLQQADLALINKYTSPR